MIDLVDHLRTARLGGYAYVTLDAHDPARSALRRDYLAALAGHESRKRELLPLVAAWNLAGIEPLIFKGFHLSEFVYPRPGMRFHGDVDVLVPAAQGREAVDVAMSLGWRVDSAGPAWSHCIANLIGPRAGALIDLHRFAVHAVHRWTGVQRRITRAVWDAALSREWHGVRIRELAPTDALLVGLVLQRCWGGDRWHLKPHDALDAVLLVERFGIALEALRARARDLRAANTLELWLARCDPFTRRVCIASPSRDDVRRWNRAAFAERGWLGWPEQALGLTSGVPRRVRDLVRGTPSYLAARVALRRDGDIHALLSALAEDAAAHPAARADRWRVVSAATMWTRLLRYNPNGDCLVRALAVFHALRRHGFDARFVSGVRRDGDRVVGHAWVELDGVVVPELREPDNRHRFTVSVEFPAGA